METRRGPKRREGRAEERQETREQRLEVKGEGGGERQEEQEGPGVQKEKEGLYRGPVVEERGWTNGGQGKTRKLEWCFQVCAKAGKLHRQGKEAVPGKQENRGRGSLVIRENLTKGLKEGENLCCGDTEEGQSSRQWQGSFEAGGWKQGRQRAEQREPGTRETQHKQERGNGEGTIKRMLTLQS